MAQEIKLQYMPLADVVKMPRNPKTHDLEQLNASIDRFGFVTPPTMDEASGMLVAGHGRIDALQSRKEKGEPPPDRVKLRKKDGEWLIPVVRGIKFASNREAEAYAIADNRLTEIGGWDYKLLSAIVAELASEGKGSLEGLGYEELELKRLLGLQESGPLDSFDPEEKIKLTKCPNCEHEWVA